MEGTRQRRGSGALGKLRMSGAEELDLPNLVPPSAGAKEAPAVGMQLQADAELEVCITQNFSAYMQEKSQQQGNTDVEEYAEDMAAFPSSRGPDKLNDFVVNTVGRFRPLIYANFGFLRRNTLETLGYLNLSYQKFGWDPDLSLRVWSSQGSVVPCNEAKIIHYFIDDGTRNNDEEKRQLDYLMLKTMWPSLGHFAEDSVYDFSKFPDYLALLDPWRRLKIMVSETNFHVAISEIHALALKSRCWGECYDIGKMMAFRGDDKLALDIFNLIIEARHQVTQDLYCWAIYQKAVLLKQKDAAESQRLMSLIEDKIEIPGS